MLSNGLSSTDFFRNIKKSNNSPTRTLQDDLTLGYRCEEEIIPILNTYFDNNFRNTKELYGNQYCNYDFLGTNGMRIELKSRRNTCEQYPTTLIPIHKCVSMDLCPNVFVFNFSDGIYYTEWNTNRFKTYETKMILCKRFNKTDYAEHYLIPISDLIKIN
jgi:hypothetical protein